MAARWDSSRVPWSPHRRISGHRAARSATGPFADPSFPCSSKIIPCFVEKKLEQHESHHVHVTDYPVRWFPKNSGSLAMFAVIRRT
jgi:hypothetical protein